MPFSRVLLLPTWMAWILPNRRSAGGLLNADASELVLSRLLMKEGEQEAETGQLVHLPSGGHGVLSVGESDRLLGITNHW